MSTQQFCTFVVNDLYFGVEVQQVQEVIRHQPMTAVPLAHRVVSGLINLRGQIVVAIDMRRRLGMEDAVHEEGEGQMNVVLGREDAPVSLQVDELGDVLTLTDEGFEAPPSTVNELTRELVHGIYKLENRLMLVLDTDRAVELPDS